MISSDRIRLLGTTQDEVVLRLTGDWSIDSGLVPFDRVAAGLDIHPGLRRVAVDARHVGDWDSSLVVFAVKLTRYCAAQGIALDRSDLPGGVLRLVDLALAVPEKADTGRGGRRDPIMTAIGRRALGLFDGTRKTFGFLGEVTLALGALLTARARYRGSDLLKLLRECGVDALPIVSSISLLVGLILAFIGAVQLRQFGAQIYVADLVGIAVAREMAAVMTAIVLAGRTGAAFAAQIGTMQSNEEIDALTTLGIPPIEFLVLPRVLAMVLMAPLLTVYAMLMGMFGGFLIGIGMLDITPAGYLLQTQNAVSLTQVAIGVVKGVIFGALVGFAGCLRGMGCGRSAAAVGQATTSAVVTGIVYIIVTDAAISMLLNVLGI